MTENASPRPHPEFDYDPPVQRPEPDREIAARAHNHMLRTESPLQAFIRQQWEAAMGATRVALDAWRRVWPAEADSFDKHGGLHDVREAEAWLEDAYLALDRLAPEILGLTMYYAQRGQLTEEQISEIERGEDEGGQARPTD